MMDAAGQLARSRPADASPGAPSTYPPIRDAGFVIGVLFVVTLLSQLDRQLPALLVRPLRKEFGISDTAFSLLQGYAFAVFYTLAGLPLGRLVDRGHRRNLIIVGLVAWSVATALFAFSQTYTHLLLARVGVGIGEAVLAPAAYSLIADYVAPARRGRALALYYVSIAIGSGASLLLGGWLLAIVPAQGMSLPWVGALPAWRIAFLAAAMPALPMALVLLLVREPARQGDPASSGVDVARFSDFLRQLKTHSATYSRVLTYPTLLSIIGYGALAWAPALFDRRFGIAPSRAGPMLGLLVAVAGALGTLASGFLSDRWAARAVPAARLRVALTGAVVFAAPAVLWPLVPRPEPAFALLFLTVFGLGLAQSAAPASIQAVTPNRMRGQAISIYLLLAGLLGIGLGPTAVALVTDRVFHDDQALPYALSLTAAPSVLIGLWLIASGLRPYARTHEALHQA